MKKKLDWIEERAVINHPGPGRTAWLDRLKGIPPRTPDPDPEPEEEAASQEEEVLEWEPGADG